ncbi:hypothetical protein GA0115253_102203, partial [Streptomyces sp. Termitarium-T10T-6]
DRYWELTAEVISAPGGPPEPTPGSAHDWLLAALAAQVEVVAGRGGGRRGPVGEAPVSVAPA